MVAGVSGDWVGFVVPCPISRHLADSPDPHRAVVVGDSPFSVVETAGEVLDDFFSSVVFVVRVESHTASRLVISLRRIGN